jgi:hypothetical protein
MGEKLFLFLFAGEGLLHGSGGMFVKSGNEEMKEVTKTRRSTI